MSFREKHLIAIDTKDYYQLKAQSVIEQSKEDTTGAVWHQEEMSSYILEKAQHLDYLQEKKNYPLYGLSYGLKDLFCVKGLTTTAGSKVLDGFKSPYDSTIFSRLETTGAWLTAKLGMDEFAMGSFSNTSFLGKVSLPSHPNRTAGGSSGGSAAAVATGLVDFSLGSDTGGSVRQPASFCGVVGYKPSYGAFSRYGMIAYASSLDQAGFFTKTLEDMAYLLKEDLAAPDKHDATTIGLSSFNATNIDLKELVYGYFPDMLEDEHIAQEVKKAYKNTLDKLLKTGIKLKPISISLMAKSAQIYYILACSEATSNLARYQGVFFGKKLIDETASGSFWEQAASYRSKYLGLEAQKRIMLGSLILSSENFSSMYQKAHLLRMSLKEEFNQVFKEVNTLVLPVSPMLAPKWSEISLMSSAQIYLSDYMTVAFSLAGLPALSLPWEKTQDNLHIGMQFVGQKMKDYQLINELCCIEKECQL